MKKRIQNIFLPISLLLALSCAGPDVQPVYLGTEPKVIFPEKKSETPDISSIQCKTDFTSTLCVAIKAEEREYGTDPADPLCVDVSPIPLEIEGDKIRMRGDTFPDIIVAGHGLPAPITINGKGTSGGSANIAEGTWTLDGDITLENFSFFVQALGAAGEIPGFTLTTGITEETPHLGKIHGQPADPDGNVILVGAMVFGHLFEAADKYLLGASLTIQFSGILNPPLASCKGDNATQLSAVKLHRSPGGQMVEEPLPEKNRMEISNGTYIAQSAQDVGPLYENMQEFKITNSGTEAVEIHIPNHLKDFYFWSDGESDRTLKPGQNFILKITFRPTKENSPAGKQEIPFRLGRDAFVLVATALESSENIQINTVDSQGVVQTKNADRVLFEPVSVLASSNKGYFECQEITCEGASLSKNCTPCTQPSAESCKLHSISIDGKPLDAVTDKCEPAHPQATPQMSMNLGETATKQVLILQNNGVKPLKILDVTIVEKEGSSSQGEFLLQKESIFLDSQFPTDKKTALPFDLPPFVSGVSEQKAFFVIIYQPKDLQGSEGNQANNGQSVWDEARLVIRAEESQQEFRLLGKTNVLDVPEMQAVIGTSTRFISLHDGDGFSMREITQESQDVAFPVMLQLADNAQAGIRITEISLSGTDAEMFQWLDTRSEIDAHTPAVGAGKRCSIPVFDTTDNRLIEERFDFPLASLEGDGVDLKPGEQNIQNLPVFGCINYHRDPSTPLTKRLFQASLQIKGAGMNASGRVLRNSDGSLKETNLNLNLIATIDPRRGKMVFRVSQTTAMFPNPQSPSLTGIATKKEIDLMKELEGKYESATVLLGSIILDPFDEMEITDSNGEIISTPGDGDTIIFRSLSSIPSRETYQNPLIPDYMSLVFNASMLQENKGIYYDYPNLPEDLKIPGWKLFTGALSYPGPLHPSAPITEGQCDVVDPCSPEGVLQYNNAGAGSDGRGACAYFYISGGDHESPDFKNTSDLCALGNQKQNLKSSHRGFYQADGNLMVENLGLRFWGPNYLHNPHSTAGSWPPLNEVFQVSFTTGVLKPKTANEQHNPIPDPKIDLSKQEYKINLDETGLDSPPLCPTNRKNRRIGNRVFSTWKYLAPLLFKDEAGTIPAGCPDEGNDFDGGTAYLRGRPLNQETGTFTIVATSKFSNREELTIAFKDVMSFLALSGWLCDPEGSEENLEGSRCYDLEINERDAASQISFIDD